MVVSRTSDQRPRGNDFCTWQSLRMSTSSVLSGSRTIEVLKLKMHTNRPHNEVIKNLDVRLEVSPKRCDVVNDSTDSPMRTITRPFTSQPVPAGIGNPVTQIDERSKHCWLLEEAEQSTEAAYLGYVNVTRSPGMRWPLADSQALPSFAAACVPPRRVPASPASSGECLVASQHVLSTPTYCPDLLPGLCGARVSSKFLPPTRLRTPNTEYLLRSPISTLAERLLRGVVTVRRPLGCRRK